MNKYKINLTAHYEKSISVLADTPEQAKEKMKTILFDTDLIRFTEEDFICGESVITDDNENNCEESEIQSDEYDEGDCSDCECCCPICGYCMCDDED